LEIHKIRDMKKQPINEKVDKVISKLKEWENKKGSIELFLNGKYEKIPIVRRINERYVTLCIRSKCDAGGDCCHYAVKEGIGVCFYSASKFDILLKGSVILSDLDNTKEEELFKTINHVLKEIHDRYKTK